MARGYLKHPEQTAEKFVPNSLTSTPGTRLYKTGDLARYHADGSIEYLGRLDFQVKVRGFRIEPGEIEAVLRRHTAVRDSIVVAQEHIPGHKRLIAYIVPQASEEVTDGRNLAAEQVGCADRPIGDEPARNLIAAAAALDVVDAQLDTGVVARCHHGVAIAQQSELARIVGGHGGHVGSSVHAKGLRVPVALVVLEEEIELGAGTFACALRQRRPGSWRLQSSRRWRHDDAGSDRGSSLDRGGPYRHAARDV